MEDVVPFLLIAHRGDSSERPENTVNAFDWAIEQGFFHIETDCILSSDNVCVVLHDEKLGRTNNGSGCAFDVTADKLLTLDAGSWFAQEYCDCRIPTLQSVLQRYASKIHLHLELKSSQEGLPLAVAEELKGAGWIGGGCSGGDPFHAPGLTITSFHLSALKAFKQACPGVRCGWLLHSLSAEELRTACEAGLEMVCPRANIISEQEVAAARSQGLLVRAWGVKDLELLEAAIAAGAHGATVNWPMKASSKLDSMKVPAIK